MTKPERVIEWLMSKVGCGYVYGATGWTCSKERRAQQAAQYPEYAKMILTTAEKWDGKQCFDCAQLVKIGLNQVGISVPSGATSQWKAGVWAERHEISETPVPDRFCVLYRADGDVMQHTGFHVGGGVTIDARSTAQGVIESLLSHYGWTHWAIPRGLEGDVKMCKKIVNTQSGSLNLRSEPDGLVIDKIPKGTEVMELEVQGEWSRIEVNTALGEVIGWVANRYLAVAPAEESPTITVSRDELWRIYNLLGEVLGVHG